MRRKKETENEREKEIKREVIRGYVSNNLVLTVLLSTAHDSFISKKLHAFMELP